MIRLYQSLVGTSSDMESALFKALREASSQLVQQQEFAAAVADFQRGLLQDLKNSSTAAHSYLAELTRNIGSAAKGMETEVSALSEVIRNLLYKSWQLVT